MPVTISESEAEPQATAPVGETITLKKAGDNGQPQKSMDKDNTSLKKDPSAELPPSESWVVVTPPRVDQSTIDAPKEKLTTMREDQPTTSSVEPLASGHNVKQAWSGSSDGQGSAASVAQPPPAVPPSNSSNCSSVNLSRGGTGKGIKVEDVEESEVKEEGIGEAVSNAVFNFGEEEEEEEPEEKYSTPSAATPQVSELLSG